MKVDRRALDIVFRADVLYDGARVFRTENGDVAATDGHIWIQWPAAPDAHLDFRPGLRSGRIPVFPIEPKPVSELPPLTAATVSDVLFDDEGTFPVVDIGDGVPKTIAFRYYLVLCLLPGVRVDRAPGDSVYFTFGDGGHGMLMVRKTLAAND